jgi:cold shock CspA family protein
MTTKEKRRSACQTEWLKQNHFQKPGFGIIQPDDGGAEVLCHITGFYRFGTGITEEGIRNLEYRRRLQFRLAVDSRSDRLVAVDVTPIREIQAADGTIIELPVRGNRAREEAAERAAKQVDGFGALVAALR